MQLEFLFSAKDPAPPRPDGLSVGTRIVPLWFVRHRRARRYILRVQPDGSARVTIPRGGSQAEARSFAERQTGWIERQLARRPAQSPTPVPWGPGTEVLYRGEWTQILTTSDGRGVQVGDQIVCPPSESGDLRPLVERHLWRLAASELEDRTRELAVQFQLTVRRVTVRNQRSRWGSCSTRGVVSLNWRLVQTPPWVRDYIIIHELMHLRAMNHSARFWTWVEQACPAYATAEAWLKQHGNALLDHGRGRA